MHITEARILDTNNILVASSTLTDEGSIADFCGPAIEIDETWGIPIVRTTTRYSIPAQRFRPVDDRLARQIQKIASLPVGFNQIVV
jgi:hypothetical protein